MEETVKVDLVVAAVLCDVNLLSSLLSGIVGGLVPLFVIHCSRAALLQNCYFPWIYFMCMALQYA